MDSVVADGSDGRGVHVVSAAALPADVWTHVAVVVSARVVVLLVDSKLSASGVFSGSRLPSNAHDLLLGCGSAVDGQPAQQFAGHLFDVRLWHGARSPEELKAERLQSSTESLMAEGADARAAVAAARAGAGAGAGTGGGRWSWCWCWCWGGCVGRRGQRHARFAVAG